MTYRQQHAPDDMKDAKCPDCGSKILLERAGKLTCTNCGCVIGPTFNRHGLKRSEFNGKRHDSKFEAGVVATLETRKRAKDIKDYDTQYKVRINIYGADGDVVDVVYHKVDCRIHHNDGSFELYEAKGREGDDYKWRRRLLEKVWLPEHLDHTYTVIKQHGRR